MVARRSFGSGWMPDADAVNAPADALLRMDNLVLDELGALALRPGSAKVNAVALADTDVHSLASFVLSGTTYRLAGAGAHVYANGTTLGVTMAGSGDVSFGSHLGQLFLTRSTSHYKYDGTTVRNWGIGMTGGTPTVAAVAGDYKIFATCASAEAPAFSWDEDNGTGASYDTGQDGTANGALVLNPNATSGRGTVTKTYASDTDFTAYVGGGVGTDDDLIQFYVYVTEPLNLKALTLMIDVNSSSTNRFQDDYYSYTFDQNTPVDLTLADADFMAREYDAEGAAYRRVQEQRAQRQQDRLVAQWRKDAPVANAGWTKLLVRRGQMVRTGSTSGKDWSTVKAIRLVAEMTGGGASSLLKFDDVRIVGGAITGRAAYRYVYVRNSTTYTAKSAPSAVSAETTFQNNNATVTAPADASRDSQVNEIWLFRMGNNLDAFYRVAVKTGVSGTGAVAITDSTSDRDALIANIRLQTDNTTPPNSIIDIEGPYYDRTFVLTATALYPSRRLDPDAYATGQVITISGADETALWVKKALGGLYIGTTKDVYRLDGTGAELPDETIDFTKTPLNIDHPPISNAVAQDGNNLVYLADDGWRAISGAGSTLLAGPTSLLYKGYTRHGISPVNLTGGRFRAAIAKGQLLAVTPEGSSTTSSTVLYRYVFALQRWYRHVYTNSLRCVSHDENGTPLASDASGFVWTLDTGTQDGTSDLAVTLWTRADDDGRSFQRKDPADARFLLDTGGNTATAALHLDGSATATTSVSIAQSGLEMTSADLSSVDAFRQAQWRITGSFSTFRLTEYQIQYEALPPLFRGQTVRSAFGYPGIKTMSALQLRLCTLGAARTFTPYVDGTAQTTFAVTTGVTDPSDYTHAFAAALEGAEVALAVDGDVELYQWQPIITAKRPLGIQAWDSGPLDLGVHEMVWIREVHLKIRASANLTITPWFDGVAFTAVSYAIGVDASRDTIVTIPVGRSYKGRIPRLVITSTGAFYPWWAEFQRRTSGTARRVQPIRVPLGLGGEQVA